MSGSALKPKLAGLRRCPLRRKSRGSAEKNRREVRLRARRRARALERQERARRRREEAELELATNRRIVLEESRGICQRCLRARTYLEVHHLVSRARGRGCEVLHATSNLAALCAACHDEIHRCNPPDVQRWILPRPRSGDWRSTG